MKLTVARKMALLAGAALIGIAILTGLNQSLVGKVFEAANYNSVNTVPSLLVLSDVRQEIARYRLRVDRHVMNTDPAKMADLEKSIKEALDKTESLFKQYEPLISDDKDRALLQKVRGALAGYVDDANLVLAESRANRNDQARDMIEKNVKSARDLDATLAELFAFNADVGHRSAEEADKTRSSAIYLALGIAALTLVIVAAIAFLITRNLVRQLGGEPDLAAEVANKIAGGDVNTKIEVKPDDTTSLMAAMQKLADKLEWYRSIIDAVPFPIHVIDMDMNWVYLNTAFEKLMVERGYVRDRQDAVGKPCSTANANICKTKNCGIEQLKIGVGQSFFDWGNLKCKQDTAHVRNARGEVVGYVETVTDLSATLSIKDFTEKEVQRVAENLERLGKGDLNLDLKALTADQYTLEVAAQFRKIDNSLKQVGASLTALITDAEMLSQSAIAGKFEVRADAEKHPGDFRKVVDGFNGTLNVVVDKLEWYRSVIDAVPFPIHVIDNDMNWTFLNSAFEKLMVERGYVRDRQDAVGRPCSTANANICKTKNCGIMQLKEGVPQSFFDWGNLKCKQDTAFVLNAKGEKVGLRRNGHRPFRHARRQGLHREAKCIASPANLERVMGNGDLNLDLKAAAGRSIHQGSRRAVPARSTTASSRSAASLTALISDANMLSEAAVALKLDTRADATKHQGDYRKVIDGVNATLDAVVNPLKHADRRRAESGPRPSSPNGRLDERGDDSRHRGQFKEVVRRAERPGRRDRRSDQRNQAGDGRALRRRSDAEHQPRITRANSGC